MIILKQIIDKKNMNTRKWAQSIGKLQLILCGT